MVSAMSVQIFFVWLIVTGLLAWFMSIWIAVSVEDKRFAVWASFTLFAAWVTNAFFVYGLIWLIDERLHIVSIVSFWFIAYVYIRVFERFFVQNRL